MKKYKLIKEYYGSLPLNTEVEFEKCCTGVRCTKLRSIGVRPEFKIDNERYPGFWEEVIEKDYEILDFYMHPCEGISNGRPFKVITKVKRLSDGEVFTVGGIVNSYVIDIICLSEEGIKIFFQDERLKPYLLKDIILRKPLFTTEDGVDIFEGDEYWYVGKYMTIYHVEKAIKGLDECNEDQKDFSIKKAAEEYVLMNKRCLSYKDLDNLFDLIMNPFYNETRTHVRNLIKKRIDGKS